MVKETSVTKMANGEVLLIVTDELGKKKAIICKDESEIGTKMKDLLNEDKELREG